MLVIDASVAVAASNGSTGLEDLPERRLLAPPLMWSEARSAIHVQRWRGELDAADAETSRLALAGLAVECVRDDGLGDEAWRIADELGWTKTYDAEYVALARLRGCNLLTVDLRLRRGADKLGLVVTPEELRG